MSSGMKELKEIGFQTYSKLCKLCKLCKIVSAHHFFILFQLYALFLPNPVSNIGYFLKIQTNFLTSIHPDFSRNHACTNEVLASRR